MMFIYSDDLSDGATIDPLFAFGKKQPDEHMAFSDNLNPHLAWRQGLNDYMAFMAGSKMAGDYFGYDGPCPPWNDERLHHYWFTVYAVDIESLDLPDRFDGRDVMAALDGHVLAEASLTGTYSLHPVRAC